MIYFPWIEQITTLQLSYINRYILIWRRKAKQSWFSAIKRQSCAECFNKAIIWSCGGKPSCRGRSLSVILRSAAASTHNKNLLNSWAWPAPGSGHLWCWSMFDVACVWYYNEPPPVTQTEETLGSCSGGITRLELGCQQPSYIEYWRGNWTVSDVTDHAGVTGWYLANAIISDKSKWR